MKAQVSVLGAVAFFSFAFCALFLTLALNLICSYFRACLNLQFRHIDSDSSVRLRIGLFLTDLSLFLAPYIIFFGGFVVGAWVAKSI